MDERTLQKLAEILEQYEYHPDCIQEILEIVTSSGNLKRFFNLFAKNTELLIQLGEGVYKQQSFEKLQAAKDLYSMEESKWQKI